MKKELEVAFNALKTCHYARGKKRNPEANQIDCGDFVRRIQNIINPEDPQIFPYFRSTKEEVEDFGMKKFINCEFGEIVLMTKINRSENNKNRKPFFSHVGIKFSETEIMHLSEDNKKPQIETISDIMKTYIVY